MADIYLDFEAPIAELQKKIDELEAVSSSNNIDVAPEINALSTIMFAVVLFILLLVNINGVHIVSTLNELNILFGSIGSPLYGEGLVATCAFKAYADISRRTEEGDP